MPKKELTKTVRERGRKEGMKIIMPAVKKQEPNDSEIIRLEQSQEVVKLTAREMEQTNRIDAMRIGIESTQMVDRISMRIDSIMDENELFLARQGIEALRALLKKTVDQVDERMIEVCQGKKISKFETGFEERKVVVFIGQEKTKKVTKDGAGKLEQMLKDKDPAKREMALRALQKSASHWSFPQVVELADTLGYDPNDFVEVVYKDRVKPSYVPKYILALSE